MARTACPLIILAVAVLAPLTLPAQAPSPAVDPKAQFETASVKPYADSRGLVLMRMLPDRWEATGVTARQLLRQALRIQDYQLAGGPDWVNSERYTIDAKAPEGTPTNVLPTMMLNLLKDRFKLALRTETRQLPVYNLVLARNDGKLGRSLKASSSECQATIKARATNPGPLGGPTALPGTPGGPPLFDPDNPQCGLTRRAPGLLGGGGQSIAQLVQMLTEVAGRPVTDKTGLTGLYDFVLTFRSDPALYSNPLGLPAPAGAPPTPPNLDGADVFTSIQEQLGLKLEGVRGPIEVTVIDQIEKPTPN